MEKANWISVKQASGICIQNQLPRSPESIRRWCANGDIEAEKRPNGRTEQWFIIRESLEIKIKEELEFLKQSERSFSQPENLTEHRPVKRENSAQMCPARSTLKNCRMKL